LEAAKEIFSQKGFGKARISEIAQLAGVAEGTIFDYFENKEDLILSIPEMRLKGHVDALDETFQVVSPMRKFRRFIKHHFWLYLPNRNFLRVILLDVQLNKRFYGSSAFKLYQTYLHTIENIIAEGKSRKCFRADIKPRVFRNMFLGAFSPMALRWLIVEKGDKYDKMKEIEQLTDLLCRSVTTTA
jgi:TetR/AcrR family fatty acid metabolism transcriptional regulator